MSSQVLTQLQSLEQLYSRGYRSGIVDATIDKLVAVEKARVEREVIDLSHHLIQFEEQYHISSKEFYHRFQAGEMGDSADVFEWSAFYQMWLAAYEQLDLAPTQQIELPVHHSGLMDVRVTFRREEIYDDWAR